MSVKSPQCMQLTAEWLRAPDNSVRHKLAESVRSHDDAEILDLVYKILTQDPPDSDACKCALALWPYVADEATKTPTRQD